MGLGQKVIFFFSGSSHVVYQINGKALSTIQAYMLHVYAQRLFSFESGNASYQIK